MNEATKARMIRFDSEGREELALRGRCRGGGTMKQEFMSPQNP